MGAKQTLNLLVRDFRLGSKRDEARLRWRSGVQPKPALASLTIPLCPPSPTDPAGNRRDPKPELHCRSPGWQCLQCRVEYRQS